MGRPICQYLVTERLSFVFLDLIGSDGQLKAEPRIFGPAMSPVGIDFVGDAAYVASIGDIFGLQTSAVKIATISRLSLVDQGIAAASISVVIDGLYRMAGMDVADFNGDGIIDFVVCGFGTRQGNVALYMSESDGTYREQVLINRPGAVSVEIHDFNGDQHLDIAVLLSDAREGLYILTNDGANQFDRTTVFETHPSFGHTYFELQDFNSVERTETRHRVRPPLRVDERKDVFLSTEQNRMAFFRRSCSSCSSACARSSACSRRISRRGGTVRSRPLPRSTPSRTCLRHFDSMNG